ncbi:MAG: ornithine cyclodeaminase family protein [Synergistales bacterium]
MANKENKVLWLSQEDCIACGAQDMKFILRNVTRANTMLGLGETREIGLVHMMWEEGKHSGKRVGLHGCIINSGDGDIHVASIKSIPSNPTNPQRLQKPRSNGLLILYDEDTGFPLAVMDDTVVSSMRTGAGSALGAKCCANPDSEVMGLLGSGVIASRCLEATSLVLDNIKVVKVYDWKRENAEKFVRRWEHLGYEFEIVDSAREAVSGSDVVHCCTLVDVGEEYIPADWLKAGSFQSFISCYDYKEECYLLPQAKYCMDWKDRLNDVNACTLTDMVLAGKIDSERVVQVSDILLGRRQCRVRHDDIVFFGSLGLCITDTLNGFEIYRQALEKGLGTWVYQWKEPAMY